MRGDVVEVATLDGAKTASLPVAKLETVIPAIGKPVRVVAGPHRGAVAVLLALHLDAFNAQLQLEDGRVVEGVPYEHICKEKGDKR